MRYKKGEKLVVVDEDLGRYLAVAEVEFDTRRQDVYPVVLDQELKMGECVLKKGERVSCTRDKTRVSRRHRAPWTKKVEANS